MLLRDTISGACLLGASFAEVDTSWLANAMIFIAAASATLFYARGAFKKTPPDNEKYRFSSECDKRCDANLREHEKLQKDIHDAIDKLGAEMRRLFRELNEKDEARAKAMHDRINPIEADVSALKSSEKSISSQIYNLENRFNSHIERRK